jgi:hypothetical protein
LGLLWDVCAEADRFLFLGILHQDNKISRNRRVMRIEKGEAKKEAGFLEISARVDGFRLWYRVPNNYPVSRAGDPFLAAALLPAMLKNEKLEINPSMPVSPKLLKNLQMLQEIHHCWNPTFKIIPIIATTSPSGPLNAGTMSFFSGGVDSTYTFLKHLTELTHVVFIQGFDFYANSAQADAFSVGDLCDLSQLAYKLLLPWDAVAAFLREKFSKSTLLALKEYVRSGSVPPNLEARLAEEINKIIAGPIIWERKRFAGINLRLQTKDLLAKAPQGEDLNNLNRLLLEDVYPLEISKKHSPIYEIAKERNSRFVKGFGKTLIPIETNHFPFGYRYNLSRNLTQGSALASIALLLGFSRVYLPGSYSYSQLIPLGSHPLTDPLWSNEGAEIIHDGAEARRVDKVMKIAKNELGLANLRVCLDDMNVNCGKCAKCIRTMVPLKLLGASAAPFPPLPPLKTIRKMRIGDEIEMIFLRENFNLALQAGNKKLKNSLSAIMNSYERKRILKEVDTVILGRTFGRLRQRIKKRLSGFRRIDTAAHET